MFNQPYLGATPKNTFLLNPKHQNFISGEERKFKDFSISLLILLLFLILMFGLIGGGMAYSGIGELTTRSQLAESGVEARATIIDTDYSTSTSKGRTNYTYYMTYEYFVRSGNADNPVRYTYRQKISDDNYNTFSRGTKLTIRYLPDSPDISRFLDDDADNGVPFAIMGGLMAGGDLLALYMLMRQCSRNKRLENEGQLVIGRITKATTSRVKAGNQVTIQYSFMSPNGGELSRKESLVRNDLGAKVLPDEGTPVAVIYVDDKLYRML